MGWRQNLGCPRPHLVGLGRPEHRLGIDQANLPFQEGSFFGNIILTGSLASVGKPSVTAPAAFYCDGAGFTPGAQVGVVAGRLGAGQSGAPYSNPFYASDAPSTSVLCTNARGVPQAGAGGPTAPDGFKDL